MKQLVTLIFIFFCLHAAIAQTTVKVVDATTGEGLPHATVQVNIDNLVTNADGYFTIPATTADDTPVTLSFLGYKTLGTTVGHIKANNFIVTLQPGVFELDEVSVSNRSNNPDSIMAAVKKNLANNYKHTGRNVKNTLFYRQSTSFTPKKLNLVLTQSTGMSKKELKQVNDRLKNFTSQLVSSPPTEFTDMLCNYYVGTKTVNDKNVQQIRFDVVKATKLKDRKKAVTVDEMREMAEGMLYEHIDTTKYYRLKSGIFGSRDTISFRKSVNRNGKKVKKTRLESARNEIMGIINNNSFQYSHNLDFVRNPEWYEYSYEGAAPTGNGDEFVYILRFKPGKSRAKYSGTLYISDKDYGILRTDYKLAEGKTLGGVNMKLLLGVKQSENISQGTIIFKPKPEGGYYLQYALEESGQYIYVNRPFKLIELTDDDRDKVAFDLKVETTITDTEEYFNMSRTDVTEAELDRVKETEFNYIHLQRYDPSIWKEYSTIEPLEEMKRFKAGG